ncbi:MAG: NAD(P)/FAD-dependent oxidoreductase [Deltaproteobacteria bacterium]|nr:NAD(P)/FAD-dependent oxidoreductase [Deltaproteobacteria bacterium]
MQSEGQDTQPTTEQSTEVPVTTARLTPSSARIVIVGGGTAGITVAARLCRAIKNPNVTIIEPSEQHVYQPGQTLVGGGVFTHDQIIRNERDYIPHAARWVKESVVEFHPEQNTVVTSSGQRIGYDYLIVAPGLQLNFDQIAGLEGHLGKDGICSIYTLNDAVHTWHTIDEFKGGNAIFTFPATPIKCAGAPQKIMYMADDTFRRHGVRVDSHVMFATAGLRIFGIDAYVGPLNRVADRRKIERKYQHQLVEVRPGKKEAVFTVTREKIQGEEKVQEKTQEVIPYDLLHVVPPMSAPTFVQTSPLAHTEGPDKGWLKVDRFTLQHLDYPNIFGLGDVIGVPSTKTGAAIRKQAPIVVHNILATIDGRDTASFHKYTGYTSCPLITGYRKLILAEFDYSGKPVPSIPWDSTKERLSGWFIKVYALPALYWHAMLRGLA